MCLEDIEVVHRVMGSKDMYTWEQGSLLLML